MRKQDMMFALAIGVGLAAGAADFQWNATGDVADWGATKVWLHMGKTPPEPYTWTGNQVAIFPEDANLAHTVNLEKSYTPGRMNVKDDYTFTGADASCLQYDLGYSFWVSEGKTATLQLPLKQTSSDSTKRALLEPTGTIDLQKGGEVYRFQLNKGTLKLTGGTLKTTGSNTGPQASSSVAGFTAGKFIVDGKSAVFQIGTTTSYVPNSGTEIVVRNGGTFDAWNAAEVLNGFADNGSTSAHASMTVTNGGSVVAQKIRVGKASKTVFESKPDYARLNLCSGGVFRVRQAWTEANLCGEVNFNGGKWEMITNASDVTSKSSINAFNTLPASSNLLLQVREGGAYLKSFGDVNVKQYLHLPFRSGAAKDGGLHFESAAGSIVYVQATNTFNGGTWLSGTGAFIFTPLHDRAFGAVPEMPSDNIFVTSSHPILHSDKDFDIHSNRTVRIAKGVTMNVGNGGKLRMRGAIRGEDKTTVLKTMGDWNGSTVLAPAEDRTNEVGRLWVTKPLVVEEGLTKVTSDSGSIHGNAAVYVNGSSGLLEMTGGTLKVTDSSENVYVETAKGGRICIRGGLFDVSTTKELLNGHDGYGVTEVCGSGRINARLVRVSQTKDVGADGLPLARIHVATGGVLRLHHFNIDTGTGAKGLVDLDGGTIEFRSTRDGAFGPGTSGWAGIHFRACAGGAILDTMGCTIGIEPSLESGATNDGGLTKKGAGKLTLKNASNPYNGPTRCDKGELDFDKDSSFPGGDLAVSAKALKEQGSLGTIKAFQLVFKPGAKVRVVEADGIDPKTCSRVTIATSDEPMVNPPTQVVVVDADGNERSSADWRVSLSADGKTLSFGKAQGGALNFR